MGGAAGGATQGGAGGGGRAGSPEHHFAMPPHLSISQSATGLTVNITMPDGKHVTNAYVSGEKSTCHHDARRGQSDLGVGRR